ncbi:hypothetical protein MPTK1_3g06600 [Marchantia polymorpha subsp. ruderalis]|uniref:Uncharacterized protein n=2 Tax=Marchantia polymorpha TaxID=3197 RepID=A0AAF6AY27_MARPO|nr:hypothetical protein MARPO_0006s0129 [Marchantia polymorpha]BBN04661.1 hypothetical protein Mp_3g06600 [Marchantia polymorpha subsp. ruderalis]|eukprot:PTQ48099.1 hypothetical protein MARPO_0006s0129 [Marchantia polymorpha]
MSVDSCDLERISFSWMLSEVEVRSTHLYKLQRADCHSDVHSLSRDGVDGLATRVHEQCHSRKAFAATEMDSKSGADLTGLNQILLRFSYIITTM